MTCKRLTHVFETFPSLLKPTQVPCRYKIGVAIQSSKVGEALMNLMPGLSLEEASLAWKRLLLLVDEINQQEDHLVRRGILGIPVDRDAMRRMEEVVYKAKQEYHLSYKNVIISWRSCQPKSYAEEVARFEADPTMHGFEKTMFRIESLHSEKIKGCCKTKERSMAEDCHRVAHEVLEKKWKVRKSEFVKRVRNKQVAMCKAYLSEKKSIDDLLNNSLNKIEERETRERKGLQLEFGRSLSRMNHIRYGTQ